MNIDSKNNRLYDRPARLVRTVVASAAALSIGLLAAVSVTTPATTDAVETKGGETKGGAYRFDSAPHFIYRFALSALVENEHRESLTGNTTLSLRDTAPASQPTSPEPLKRAAFAIDEKGRFVTCARAVFDKESVELQIGDQKREARILARDELLDLALLQVDSLQTLPLRLSDVDLAKDREFQAVGAKEAPSGMATIVATTKAGDALAIGDIPLTRLVGGVDLEHHGGPLLDDSGLVAGVVAMMPESPTPEDRWALSAKVVREWLKEVGVELPAPRRGANGSPTEALKRAEGSTALVVGKGAALNNAERRYLLETEMNWTSSDRLGADAPKPIAENGSRSGMLVVDSTGHVIRSEKLVDCPYLFEPFPAFAIGALPGGSTTWRTHHSRIIADKTIKDLKLTEKDCLIAIRRAHGVEGFLGLAVDERIGQFTDVVDHKAVSVKGDLIQVEFKRAASLRWRIGADFVETLVGNGRYAFDRKVGVLRDARFEGRWELTGGRVRAVPLNWTLERRVEKEKKAPAAKIAPEPKFATKPRPAPKMKPRPAPKPPDFAKMFRPPGEKPADALPAGLAKSVKTLVEDEEATAEMKLAALRAIEKTTPDDRFQSQVVAAVAERLNDDDAKTKIAALAALKKWDSAACVDEALPLLEDGEESVRHATIAYLGEMNEASAADGLIERLASIADRELAAGALRKLGVVVEKEVAEIGLSHESVDVRRECCKILGDLGEEAGPDAVRGLRKLARSTSEAAPAAKDALGKLGLPVDPPSAKKKSDASKPAPSDGKTKKKPPAEKADDDENPFAPGKG